MFLQLYSVLELFLGNTMMEPKMCCFYIIHPSPPPKKFFFIKHCFLHPYISKFQIRILETKYMFFLMLVLCSIVTSIRYYNMHLPKLWLYLSPVLLLWAQLFSRLIFPYPTIKSRYIIHVIISNTSIINVWFSGQLP